MLKKLRRPKQKTLPSVLTIDQVHRLIAAVKQHRNAAYFWTVYTLGLRLEEGLHLQVGDLDAQRMMVHVHRGKGAKDRYLPLPKCTLAILRGYWSTHRNPLLLFPAIGRNKQAASSTTRPMDATTVQGCMKRVVEKLQLKKKVSTHTLRHGIATHLFEAGVSLRWMQKFLGHRSLQTTLVYLHLTDDGEDQARAKLDEIPQPCVVTFTVPQALRKIVRANGRVCYQAIFDAGSQTIRAPGVGTAFHRHRSSGFLRCAAHVGT